MVNDAAAEGDAVRAPVVNVHAPRPFRAPAFLEHKIKVWFTLLEAQFTTANIIDENIKYCNTLSSLTEKAIGQLEDILVNPPQENKYAHLKEKMIERLTESDSERVRKLLEGEQMGDRKPSEFFRCLKSHATASTSKILSCKCGRTLALTDTDRHGCFKRN